MTPFRPNALLAAWQSGRSTLNSWLFVPEATTAEAMAHAGFDSLCIDMQHGLIGYQRALEMLRAISTTTTVPLVRPLALEANIIGQVLDAGAYGVICPLVNSADDARELVAACRYPPRGRRSFGPMRASLYSGGNYFRDSESQMITLAMIETASALDNLDAILAVDGLTGVYIGPADLAIALGVAPKIDPDDPTVVAAIERIITSAKAAAKRVGMHCNAPDYAKRMRELGADMLTVGSDLRMLRSSAEGIVKAMAGNGGGPAAAK
jgi:4-hydroxy-2-oxoheptanedioate aldolase